jgi:hypothetical protein
MDSQIEDGLDIVLIWTARIIYWQARISKKLKNSRVASPASKEEKMKASWIMGDPPVQVEPPY